MLSRTKKILTKAAGFIGSTWMLFSVLCGQAYALLPDESDLIPDDVTENSSDVIGFLLGLVTFAIKGAAVVLGAVVIMGVGIRIWNAYMEANAKKGGWGDFAITAVVGVVVVVLVVVMIILAISYL